MVKATWHGHQVYMVDAYANGWAKIAFYVGIPTGF